MERWLVQLMKFGGMMMSEKNELSFEKALEELEKIVEQLEKDDVPLEKAITSYQKGMELSKICDEKLQHAEEKMTQIINKENEREPFNVQED